MNRHVVQVALLNRDAGVKGVDDGAVAGVDTNVGSATVVSNDVTRLQLIQGYRGTGGSLCLRGTRNLLASLSVCPAGQTGAVKGVRASGCLLYTSDAADE